jgi:heme/copper-type cytochrome/quinol oxidase subunit 2
MKKFLSAVSLFLMSCWAFAATKEIEGATAPVETVDVIYVVIFVVIFVASIVGFFVYLYMNDKKQKPDQ